MALFKKISDLPRTFRSWGALGLVLALAFVFGSQEVTAQTQTITLNTGLVGQAGSTLISFLQLDDDWRVTADPVKPNVPRPVYIVYHVPLSGQGSFKFPTPLPNSRWISGTANRYAGSLPPPRTSFTYQLCFTIPRFFSAPQLTMQLRGDDIIRRVKLNSTTIFDDPDPTAKAGATKLGSHLGPPLAITWTTGFQGGQNCLEVVVEDVERQISGLNVAGTVTYQPGVLVAAPVPVPCVISGQVITTDLSTGTTNGVKNALGVADPKWQLIQVPTGTAGQTFSTGAVGTWVSNAQQPANWIQRIANVNPQQDAAGPYTYRVQFPLNPSLYSGIQLTFRYAADNAAVVQLNGIQVAACGGQNCFALASPSWNFVILSTPATTFLNGVNSLNVVVTNNGAFTGLIVDARLRLTCK